MITFETEGLHIIQRFSALLSSMLFLLPGIPACYEVTRLSVHEHQQSECTQATQHHSAGLTFDRPTQRCGPQTGHIVGSVAQAVQPVGTCKRTGSAAHIATALTPARRTRSKTPKAAAPKEAYVRHGTSGKENCARGDSAKVWDVKGLF